MRVELHDWKISPPVAAGNPYRRPGAARTLLAEGAAACGPTALTSMWGTPSGRGVPGNESAILDEVVITFGLADASQNNHIPLLTTLGAFHYCS